MAERTAPIREASPAAAALERFLQGVDPDYVLRGNADLHVNAAGEALLQLCEEVTRAVELLEQCHVGAWWASFFLSRPWLESLTVSLSLRRTYDALGNAIYNEHVEVEGVVCSADALGEHPTLPVDDDGESLRLAIAPICEATLESLRLFLGRRRAELCLQRDCFQEALANSSGREAFEVVRAGASLGACAPNHSV